MRSRFEPFFLVAIVAVALTSLSACGGGSSGTKTTPPPPPSEVLLYPSSASVPVGQKVQFTAFVPSLPNSTFTWAVTAGSSNGSVTSGGLFTAMGTCPGAATVTATSAANTSFAGVATVNVTCAQAVAVAPAAVAVKAGGMTTFTAIVNGNPAVATWYVNGILGGDTLYGTIDANGNYTAPAMPPPGGVAPITAISGGNSGTAAVTVVFSNNSFKGPYAFSYTGDDGAFLAVAGSFTADGNGNITDGVEDVASAHSGKSAQVTFTGTYNIKMDGGATATLSNGNILQFALAANPSAQAGRPAQHALVCRFGSGASDTATGSGTIDQQNPGTFSVASFFGNYAFALSGVDLSNNLLQLTGKFNATGAGISIPPGFAEEDISYKKANTSAAVDTSLQGGFQMDPTYGASNGRGVVTLKTTSTVLSSTAATTTFQFAFYFVDSTHMKVTETTDTANFLVAGDFRLAPSDDGSFTDAIALPQGNYAFTCSGSASQGGHTLGGILASNGAGGFASVLDINNSGGQQQLDSASSGSFSVDPNLGRITLTLTAGTSGTLYEFAGYTASNGSVVLIEIDANGQTAGTAYPQSGTTALNQGTYALNFSELANSNKEQDALGQATTANGTLLTGTLSVNNFSTPAIAVGEPLLPATSMINAPDTNGRGTLTLATANTTYPLAYYVVDNNTVLMLGTDSTHVATGTIARQF